MMEMTTVVLSKNCEKKKLLPSDDILHMPNFWQVFMFEVFMKLFIN